MNGTEERLDRFDLALARFLSERAASVAEPTWDVRAEADDEWEIALWLNGRYAGTWNVTNDGSTRLDTDKKLYVAIVVGEDLIDREKPPTSDMEVIGDAEDGVFLCHGDREGVALSILADDEYDAERRIIRTFSDSVYIDELVPAAPVPDDVMAGIRALQEAAR